MQLISVGDHIESGIYTVHSKFKDIVNLISNNGFVSVASTEKYFGPYNIIIDDFLLSNINKIEINDYKLSINNYYFHINKEIVWSSFYLFPEIDSDALLNKINCLINTLKTMVSDHSLLFIQNKKLPETLYGFNKELYKSIKTGIDTLYIYGPEKGIPLIKGKGMGLTPSGDDFITGYLYALYTLEKIYTASNYDLRKKIFNDAISTNIISNFQLKAASEGWFSSCFFPLLDFLFKNNNFNCLTACKPLLSCGFTSGEDILSGFILSLKFFLTHSY